MVLRDQSLGDSACSGPSSSSGHEREGGKFCDQTSLFPLR